MAQTAWVVTGPERVKHDAQFLSLRPVNGVISPDAARQFFMQSGLPSSVLAQAWDLAEYEKNGQMTAKKFSIAMFLIHKKLQGFSLPPVLPDSLKFDPDPAFGDASMGMGAPPMLPGGSLPSMGHPPMRSVAPIPFAGSPSHMPSGAPPAMPPRPGHDSPIRPTPPTRTDWSMPTQTKLKYSQMFNSLDKQRVGLLTGVHARNIMSQSGLHHAALAQIWTLSDLDRDGQLTIDEFCIAMHLIDIMKAQPGLQLPAQTPMELITPGRARTISTGSDVGSMDADGQSPRKPVTFEDRRKENIERGNFELERRRALLQEQEKQEREARERREREFEAKRERERQMIEEKQRKEQEAVMARQREIEQQRMEAEQRAQEQRDQARRELEKQRQAEGERRMLQELSVQRQREQEAVCHLKQRKKNLEFQFQALQEKSTELTSEIADVRNRIAGITSDIDGKRSDRDTKVSNMQRAKAQCTEAETRLAQLAAQKAQLRAQFEQAHTSGSQTTDAYRQIVHAVHLKEMNIETLRSKSMESEKLGREKQEHAKQQQNQLDTLTNEVNELRAAQASMQTQARQKQQAVRHLMATASLAPSAVADTAVAQQAAFNGVQSASGGFDGFDSDFSKVPAAEAVSASTNSVTAAGEQRTAKYRAIYEFKASNNDELSFQPGDIVTVFVDHQTEPGWLAGQFQGQVGWFPQSYVELADGGESTVSGGPEEIPRSGSGNIQFAGGEVQVLDGIHEEPSDRNSMPAAGASASESVTGEALHTWKGKLPEHLSFSKGDVIRITARDEMWWTGELNGQRGLFPKSYVKILENAAASAATVQSPTTAPASGAITATTGQYVAIYPFVASEPGDLGFNQGDTITVISTEGEWWTGQVDGREGIFPAGYVQACGGVTEPAAAAVPDIALSNAAATTGTPTASETGSASAPSEVVKAIAPFEPASNNQLRLNLGDVVLVRAKSPTGWWEGEIDDPTVASTKRVGWFPGNFVQTVADGSSLHRGSVVSGAGSASAASAGAAAAGSQFAVGDRLSAIYDYAAQREDELSFSVGQVVVLLELHDDHWGRGRLEDSGVDGLLPLTYVQPAASSVNTNGTAEPQSGVPASQSKQSMKSATGSEDLRYTNGATAVVSPTEDPETARTRTHRMHVQELLATEKNFIEDLELVRKVYFEPLCSVLNSQEQETLMVNWTTLERVCQRFAKELRSAIKRQNSIADLISEYACGDFKEFVTFCKYQQNIIDFVEEKRRSSEEFATIYTECMSHKAARQMPINYFLLIPMTRVTKYPLVVEKILKHTRTTDEEHPKLQKTLDTLKQLCSQVNKVVDEMESLQMLYWAQQHMRCEAIQPKIVFHSQTRYMGPRRYVHGGVLKKLKSGRLLVAILFNDILLFTTPDEQIDEPDSFKLGRSSEIDLNLYRNPVILWNVKSIVAGESADAFTITTNDYTTDLRAISVNSRQLWITKLEQACREAKDAHAKATKLPAMPGFKPKSRVLVEVVTVSGLNTPMQFNDLKIVCEMQMASQISRGEIDITLKTQRMGASMNRRSSATDVSAAPVVSAARKTSYDQAANSSLANAQFVLGPDPSDLQINLCAESPFTVPIPLGRSLVSYKDIEPCGTRRGPVLLKCEMTTNYPLEGSEPAILLKLVLHKVNK